MSSTIAALSPLLDALGRVPFLIGALTKGTLLVLIALCIARLLARSPAAARHLVWSLAIGGLLLLPFTAVMPWRIELAGLATLRNAFAPTAGAPAEVRSSATAMDTSRIVIAAKVVSVPAVAPASESDAQIRTVVPGGRDQGPAASLAPDASARRSMDPAMLLVLVWLGGVVWMLGRLTMGVMEVRRMVRSARPADGPAWTGLIAGARRAIGARSSARIVIGADAAMPFTYGLVRPVIVLPGGAAEWTPERRRSVLLHELAHVRRGDLITNALVQLASAIYWFHPLVRLAARHVRFEAERSCDALVVATGTRASDYAGDLLDIARTMRSSATAAVALAVARRSDFEGRLLAILAPDCGRNVLTAARAMLIALSFAAPAVAIAAAVPAREPTPLGAPDAAQTADVARPDGQAKDTGEARTPGRSVGAVKEEIPDEHAPEPHDAERAAVQAQDGRRDTAVPALLGVVNDENAQVRFAAVQALGQLADPRAIDALVQVLRTDTDARVREAAAEALGQIESPRAVPGLIAAMGAEKVADVRAKIAEALGQIGDARAVEVLTAAVRDPEVEVRREVVEALGQLESKSAAPALIVALRDTDVETRKGAAQALGQIESREAVDALGAATKDANAEVRQQAVEALGEISDKRALPALSAAMRDAEVEVRREAIAAIGQLDDLESAPPALVAAARDEDRGVRKAAAEALGQIEDESAVPALIVLTRDTDMEVKRAAVEALSEIGGTQAIQVMAALLKDDDPEIRRLAAEALGKHR